MKCKKSDHRFVIDTPVINDEHYNKQEYYQGMIDDILNGTDDWFYPRTEVFTHLKCILCQKEDHIYLNARYLQTVLGDPDFCFGIESLTRLKMIIGGETYTYDVKI